MAATICAIKTMIENNFLYYVWWDYAFYNQILIVTGVAICCWEIQTNFTSFGYANINKHRR